MVKTRKEETRLEIQGRKIMRKIKKLKKEDKLCHCELCRFLKEELANE